MYKKVLECLLQIYLILQQIYLHIVFLTWQTISLQLNPILFIEIVYIVIKKI